MNKNNSLKSDHKFNKSEKCMSLNFWDVSVNVSNVQKDKSGPKGNTHLETSNRF